MSTMRALGLDAPGSLDTLSVRDLPIPEPGPGAVRLRVARSALNPADLKVLTGDFFGRFLHGREVPIVTGYDLAGTVDAVGPGADLAVGDRVFGHLAYAGDTKRGAFAQFAVAPADSLAKIPDGVTEETAAAAATAGLTALQALRDKGSLPSGGRALIVGASGGVGSLAVGVASRLGAEVTAICSTHAVTLVESLGADRVIDRKKEEPLTGGPYDVVLDTPGVHSYGAVAKILSPTGAYVTTLPSPAFALGKLRTLFSSRTCEFVVVQSKRADLELIGGWLADGMQAPVDSRYPVTELKDALEALAAGGRTGRIVIDVSTL